MSTHEETLDKGPVKRPERYTFDEHGRPELRRFHTRAREAAVVPADELERARRLGVITKAGLLVGNAALLGLLIGATFGSIAGVVVGAVSLAAGWAWTDSLE